MDKLDKLLNIGMAILMLLFVITNIQARQKLQQIDRDIEHIRTSLNVMDKRAYIYGNWASVEEYQGVLG